MLLLSNELLPDGLVNVKRLQIECINRVKKIHPFLGGNSTHKQFIFEWSYDENVRFPLLCVMEN